ncbi:MAG TPA: hydroxymethylglutaryl-CoA lyase [Bacteroidia bacterium]|nr:hydroxymethylglutaryl-CoA lyase [Bacteroidia bacterium]
MNPIKIIECPRDAMQGFSRFISTETKIEYINNLLKVGFDTLDFGSFVSPKHIPQMRDTEEVLKNLDLSTTKSKLLAIIANNKGAEMAVSHNEITYLGFPFSVSETFQVRNTNSTIAQSFETVKYINTLCRNSGKELLIYISMGFGNPYGDPWNTTVVDEWVDKMAGLGVKTISLSDTVGVATPDKIAYMFGHLIPKYPGIEFGAHLHTRKTSWREKIDAAWDNGCRRFDGAINGFGGCPMAEDELTGNMPTEFLLQFLDEKGLDTGINRAAFTDSMLKAGTVFAGH